MSQLLNVLSDVRVFHLTSCFDHSKKVKFAVQRFNHANVVVVPALKFLPLNEALIVNIVDTFHGVCELYFTNVLILDKLIKFH